MNRPIPCACLMLIGALSGGPAAAKDAGDYLDDARNYVLAPLSWDATDWGWFAGSVAAVAAAHHYDDNVRGHFAPRGFTSGDPHELRDFLPAAALTGGVLFTGFLGDPHSQSTGSDMVEAGVFAGGVTFALKYAAGRDSPNETADSSRWFAGGDSFPSLHAAVAFAVAAAFAEQDADNPWTRRLVAYGLVGTGTAYLRLKDNQHWLSDTLAGAAIGISTGVFVDHRATAARGAGRWSVRPAAGGGLAVNYTHPLD